MTNASTTNLPALRSRCTICKRSDQAEINRKLAAGLSARAVAAQHDGLGRESLRKHSILCVPAKIAIANADRAEKLETGTLIDQLQSLQRRALALLDAAERGGSFVERARALRECRENVIGLGRLTGAIGAANVVVDNRSVSVTDKSIREKLDALTTEQLIAIAEGTDLETAL